MPKRRLDENILREALALHARTVDRAVILDKRIERLEFQDADPDPSTNRTLTDFAVLFVALARMHRRGMPMPGLLHVLAGVWEVMDDADTEAVLEHLKHQVILNTPMPPGSKVN